MSAADIQRPQNWTPMELDCPACGTKYRLHLEIVPGPSATQWYQHCEKDEGGYIPGQLFAVYELRNGEWVQAER